jgi:hypothetical protein
MYLLRNSSRLYSNKRDIQNYCFPMFTDFITGCFVSVTQDHLHLAITSRASIAERTPRQKAELQLLLFYIVQHRSAAQ